MKVMSKVLVAGVGAVLLAGCAAKWDVDGIAAQTSEGTTFVKALHSHYSKSAAFERGEKDWSSVAFFVERARTAASGMAPEPTSPAEWGLTGAADLDAARGLLVAALGTNAPAHAPDHCAGAQVNYDHWVEQREEGHQADHIAAAKAAFEAGLAGCVEPPRAEVVAPQSFIVHFDFDSAAVNSAAQATLRQAAAAFATTGMTAIDVIGHTDTAGASEYNQRLSQRRAEAVMTALAALGVPTNAMTLNAHGQDAPVVAGEDMPEQRNRRVELTVRP